MRLRSAALVLATGASLLAAAPVAVGAAEIGRDAVAGADGGAGTADEVHTPGTDGSIAAQRLASVLTPDARRALVAARAVDMVSVIVRLSDQVDIATVLAAVDDDELARESVLRALQVEAESDQHVARFLATIWELSGEVESFTPFWIVNGFALSATPAAIIALASLPGVAAVDVEHQYQLAGTAPSAPPTVNVAEIGAPVAWAQGHTGEGIVVAVLDTGVDLAGIPGVFSSEVATSYRGGTNSWFDPYGGSTEPYDPSGHGTSVASIITGRDQSGSAVGVAPDSRWIAAKVFDDDGVATTAAIHASLQWVLDPDGDPATDDGADVVNASWTAQGSGCDLEFAPDIATLRAAGV
ncbi:MAG: S8 family serine peptidase, partial [Acidimicrobiales bacterium]